jgi:hypothetical protein
MSEREFAVKTCNTYMIAYRTLQIQGKIIERANRWTESRDVLFTTEVQKIDACLSLQDAEHYWSRLCGNPAFKFVDPEILNKRAIEIRMLCMDEIALESISVRCWNYILKTSSVSQAQQMFDRHIARYGPIKQAIADRMSTAIVSALRQDLEKVKKANLWRKLLAATEILGYGLSRLDEKIYQAWWESVIERRERVEIVAEDDGTFTWEGIPVKEDKLCEWVAERIMNMQISGAVDALKRFRIMLDPPMDLVQKVARHLLENSERPKDYVKTWVFMYVHSVMRSPWLLQRLFEIKHNEKDLKQEFRRRGGKCLRLKISEAEIPVETLAE